MVLTIMKNLTSLSDLYPNSMIIGISRIKTY